MSDQLSNPILKFIPNQIENVRSQNGFNDIKSINDAVCLLEQWVKKQDHFLVKDLDKRYLEFSIVISAKGSIEKAKKRLDKLFTLKTLMPELLQNYKLPTEFNRLIKNFLRLRLLNKIAKTIQLLKTHVLGCVIKFLNEHNSLSIFERKEVLKMFARRKHHLASSIHNVVYKKGLLMCNSFETCMGKGLSHHCAMPKPTKDLYRVLINRIGSDLSNIDIAMYGRYNFLFGEYVIMNDYVMGFEVIVDFVEPGLGVVKFINPAVVAKILTILIEGYGLRIKAIHLITPSKIVDAVVFLIKQGMSEKMGQRLQVHHSFETLHNHFSKDELPSDYGGNEKSISELAGASFKELTSNKNIEWMKLMETYQVDESKRQDSPFNYDMGVAGSFRVLNVD